MSIHYPFPLLNHIDDVLPHIDDASFRVSEKDCGHTFINYVRMGPETFPPVAGTMDERLHAAIRRECRGLAFNTRTGRIMSRPFHKFFNIGENEDTTIAHVGFNLPHVMMDKLDGSMIRPLLTSDGFRWGTKAGVTDTSLFVDAYTAEKPKYRKFAMQQMGANRTAIFEYMSPENRIVVDYGKRDLVLLAIRDNLTGAYMPYDVMALLAEAHGIPVVRVFDTINGDAAEWIERMKASTDFDEGVVWAWPDGHRVKGKTDAYTILHKVKEAASTERTLVLAILEEVVDDLLPLVPEDARKDVEAFIKAFWAWVDSLSLKAELLYSTQRELHATKKDFALASSDWLQLERSLVFAQWDGKGSAEELVMNLIRVRLSSETKWKEFREEVKSVEPLAAWKNGGINE